MASTLIVYGSRAESHNGNGKAKQNARSEKDQLNDSECPVHRLDYIPSFQRTKRTLLTKHAHLFRDYFTDLGTLAMIGGYESKYPRCYF
jgi:hypothetical protein